MDKIRKFSPWLVIVILCGVLYLWGIKAIPLTDPDEAFYAETAQEMISHHSFLTPLIFGHPQFEKPPLFYWLLMGSFKTFGITTFAARLIPSLFGIIGIIGIYFFSRKILPEKTALCSSFILAASLLYFCLSRAALTDIVFSVFVAFSLFSFYLWYKFRGSRYLILFGVFCALSVLTKGPLGMVLSFGAVIVFLAVSRDFKSLKSFIVNKWWILFLLLVIP